MNSNLDEELSLEGTPLHVGNNASKTISFPAIPPPSFPGAVNEDLSGGRSRGRNAKKRSSLTLKKKTRKTGPAKPGAEGGPLADPALIYGGSASVQSQGNKRRSQVRGLDPSPVALARNNPAHKKKPKAPASDFTFDIEYSVPAEADGLGLLEGPEDYFDSYARLGSSRRSSRRGSRHSSRQSARSRTPSIEKLQINDQNNNNNNNDSFLGGGESQRSSLSMPSLLEEDGSVDSNATIQEILFRETPDLPKIDTHVRRDSLKFQNMSAKLREERIIGTPSGRVRVSKGFQQRQRKRTGSMESLCTVKESSRMVSSVSDRSTITMPSLPGLPEARSSVKFTGVEELRRELKRMEHDRKQLKHFRQDDVEKAILYVDSFGDGDGMISLEEFEHAFKRSRRAIATQSEELQGRKLMKRLQYLLKQLNMDIPTWFRTMDTTYRRGEKRGDVIGDGLISTLELKQGLTRMAAALVQGKGRRRRRKNGAINPYEFSTRDIVCLLRYMDPNGDGDLSLEEVEEAFERAQAPPETLKIQMECGQVLKELWDQMQVHNMRVRDLFNIIDTDGSGYINSAELSEGIRKLNQKPAQERALEERLLQLEKMQSLTNKKNQVRLAEAEQKIKESLADGSFQLIQGLYIYMKKRQLRLKDLFTKAGVDKSGDGSLDAQELCEVMKMFKIKCSKKQASNLVKKLDEGGNGSVEIDELEEAIKSHRKWFGVLKKEGIPVFDLLKEAGLPTFGSSMGGFSRSTSFESMASLESLSYEPPGKARKRTDAEIGKNLEMFRDLVNKHFPDIGRKGSLQRSSSTLEDYIHSNNNETDSLEGSMVSQGDDSLYSVASAVVHNKRKTKARRRAAQKASLPPALPGSELDTSWLVSWDSRMEKNVRRLGCV